MAFQHIAMAQERCSNLPLDMLEATGLVWAPVTDTQEGSQWEIQAHNLQQAWAWHVVRTLTQLCPFANGLTNRSIFAFVTQSPGLSLLCSQGFNSMPVYWAGGKRGRSNAPQMAKAGISWEALILWRQVFLEERGFKYVLHFYKHFKLA